MLTLNNCIIVCLTSSYLIMFTNCAVYWSFVTSYLQMSERTCFTNKYFLLLLLISHKLNFKVLGAITMHGLILQIVLGFRSKGLWSRFGQNWTFTFFFFPCFHVCLKEHRQRCQVTCNSK